MNKMYSSLNEEKSHTGSLKAGIDSGQECSFTGTDFTSSQVVKSVRQRPMKYRLCADTDFTPSQVVKSSLLAPPSILSEAESVLAAYMPVPSQKPMETDFFGLHDTLTSTSIERDTVACTTAEVHTQKQTSSLSDTGISNAQSDFISRKDEKAITHRSVKKSPIKQQKRSIFAGTEMEDEAVLGIETISMHAVNIKQARRKTRSFFFNMFILFMGILLLAMLAIFIVIIPNLIYKIEISILGIVGFSYIVSTEAKCIYQARRQRYLTAAQIVPMTKKKATSSSSKDMQHFLFVAQDTETFLRAITTKRPSGELR